MRTAIKTVCSIMVPVTIAVLSWHECKAQTTTNYIPHPQSVRIGVQTNGQSVSATVFVGLPAPFPCFSITNWGQPSRIGNTISADAQFWETAAYCPTVL